MARAHGRRHRQPLVAVPVFLLLAGGFVLLLAVAGGLTLAAAGAAPAAAGEDEPSLGPLVGKLAGMLGVPRNHGESEARWINRLGEAGMRLLDRFTDEEFDIIEARANARLKRMQMSCMQDDIPNKIEKCSDHAYLALNYLDV